MVLVGELKGGWVQAPPPGFYPDPQGPPGQNRYWNGANWTEQVQQPSGQVGPPQAPPPWGYPPPGGYAGYQPSARTSGLAIASLVLSIVWLGGLGSVLAVIFALTARGDIRRSRGAVSGEGLAVAGLVIGIIGVAGAVAVWSIAISAGSAIRRVVTPTDVALGHTVHVSSVLQLGDGITQVTVYAVRYPIRSQDPSFSTPPAGEEWASADVQMCAGPDGSITGPDTGDFQLVFQNDQSVPPTFGDLRTRSIPTGSLRAHQCVRGSVPFAIPAGSHPSAIQFGILHAYRWILPQGG